MLVFSELKEAQGASWKLWIVVASILIFGECRPDRGAIVTVCDCCSCLFSCPHVVLDYIVEVLCYLSLPTSHAGLHGM